MAKYSKSTRTLLGTVVAIDSHNDMSQSAYGIKNENGETIWLWESMMDEIVLPTISTDDSYKVAMAKRQGYGLAEFIKQYANEREQSLETLVEAWIHGYMEH